MKRLILLVALLVIGCGALAEELPVQEQSVSEPPERLAGRIIGLDPGHQAHQNSEQEQVAPDRKETKKKVSSGTAGVKSRIPEHRVNLEVAFLLREALIAEGAQVVMTRESEDVDISNRERAILCNEAGCDLVLRIHCNGSSDRSVHGIGLYIAKSYACPEQSRAAAECLLPCMAEATGAKANGVYLRDSYTGMNWSEVPCILVEMGYMSNPEEDLKLTDPDYQALLVRGMTEGVCAYFEADN